MSTILVVDLGTSTFKFALFDPDGHLRGLSLREPALTRPTAGWLELAADDFRRTLAEGIADVARQAGGLSDTEAVSFATQTNSFLLLDDRDRPLTPLILWPDRRAEGDETEIQARGDVPALTATTGIPAMSFQFMLAKLCWLRRREPDAWRRLRRLCLISDYLTLLMTGCHVTEAGAAGLTALVDIHRRDWWAPMLERFELERGPLPEIVLAGTDLGPITAAAAGEFGLPTTCRFVVGCLDQYAGAIGAGNVEPGQLSETTGTVLATVRLAEGFASGLPAVVFQGPAFADRLFWRMAFGEVSASYLHWYRDLLPDRPDFETLIALADAVAPGADGLRLATDAPPSTLEAVFRGLSSRHARGHQVRAIFEAVARALGEQVAAVSDGVTPAEIRSTGGAARGGVWLQIKADMLGIPVRATRCPEPTSLGAAVLAGAVLRSATVPEVARQWVHLAEPHWPDAERHRLYEQLRTKT